MIKNFLDFSKCHTRVSGGNLKLKGIMRINLASSGDREDGIDRCGEPRFHVDVDEVANHRPITLRGSRSVGSE